MSPSASARAPADSQRASSDARDGQQFAFMFFASLRHAPHLLPSLYSESANITTVCEGKMEMGDGSECFKTYAKLLNIGKQPPTMSEAETRKDLAKRFEDSKNANNMQIFAEVDIKSVHTERRAADGNLDVTVKGTIVASGRSFEQSLVIQESKSKSQGQPSWRIQTDRFKICAAEDPLAHAPAGQELASAQDQRRPSLAQSVGAGASTSAPTANFLPPAPPQPPANAATSTSLPPAPPLPPAPVMDPSLGGSSHASGTNNVHLTPGMAPQQMNPMDQSLHSPTPQFPPVNPMQQQMVQTPQMTAQPAPNGQMMPMQQQQQMDPNMQMQMQQQQMMMQHNGMYVQNGQQQMFMNNGQMQMMQNGQQMMQMMPNGQQAYYPMIQQPDGSMMAPMYMYTDQYGQVQYQAIAYNGMMQQQPMIMQQQPMMMQQNGMMQPQLDPTDASRATSNNSGQQQNGMMQPQQQQMGFQQPQPPQQPNSWGQIGAVSPQMPMQGGMPGSTGTPGPLMPPGNNNNPVSPVPPAPGHAPNDLPHNMQQQQPAVSPSLEETQRQSQMILQQSAASTPQSQGAMRPFHQNMNVPLGANPHGDSGPRANRRPSIQSNSGQGIFPPPPPKASRPNSNISGKSIPPAPSFAPSANPTGGSGISIPPPPPGPVSEISGGSMGSKNDSSNIEQGMQNLSVKQPEVAPILTGNTEKKSPQTPTAANSAGKSSGTSSWAAMAAKSGGAGSKGPGGVAINMQQDESAAAASEAGKGAGGGKNGKGKGKGNESRAEGKGGMGNNRAKMTPKHGGQTPKRGDQQSTPCQFHARGVCQNTADSCGYSHNPKDFTHEKLFQSAQNELQRNRQTNSDGGDVGNHYLWISHLPKPVIASDEAVQGVCANLGKRLVDAVSAALLKVQADEKIPINFSPGQIRPNIQPQYLTRPDPFCYLEVNDFDLACHLIALGDLKKVDIDGKLLSIRAKEGEQTKQERVARKNSRMENDYSRQHWNNGNPGVNNNWRERTDIQTEEQTPKGKGGRKGKGKGFNNNGYNSKNSFNSKDSRISRENSKENSKVSEDKPSKEKS